MEASPRNPSLSNPQWTRRPAPGRSSGEDSPGGFERRIHRPRATREPWKRTSVVPSLADTDVQVFRASLDWTTSERHLLRPLLNSPTPARNGDGGAEPARGDGPGSRAQALLRILLGEHLGLSPQDVQLVPGPPGELPSCTLEGDGAGELFFDFGRAGDVGLFAFTRSGPLGIAVEELEPLEDPAAATSRLSPVERKTLLRLPPGLREEGFHQCWSRKRALVRALRWENAAPCDFDVSVTPGVPPRVYRWVRGNPAEWSLAHLRPAPTLVGAVAVLGDVGDIRTWSLARPLEADV